MHRDHRKLEQEDRTSSVDCHLMVVRARSMSAEADMNQKREVLVGLADMVHALGQTVGSMVLRPGQWCRVASHKTAVALGKVARKGMDLKIRRWNKGPVAAGKDSVVVVAIPVLGTAFDRMALVRELLGTQMVAWAVVWMQKVVVVSAVVGRLVVGCSPALVLLVHSRSSAWMELRI